MTRLALIWLVAALGRARRTFSTGETPFSILVTVDGLWLQTLQGGLQRQRVETTWALVGYPNSAKGA